MKHHYTVRYQADEAMGVAIALQARRLKLTPEQLIRRVMARALGDVGISDTAVRRETDPKQCWIRNGALMPPRIEGGHHETAPR